MGETCGVRDPNDVETFWYCDQVPNHDAGMPVRHHQTTYYVTDPANPPASKPAVHAWDETVPPAA